MYTVFPMDPFQGNHFYCIKTIGNISSHIPQKHHTCVGVDTSRDMEVAQGVSMMSDVAVSVCVLCAELRGQQLTVCHQSGGPSTPATQML